MLVNSFPDISTVRQLRNSPSRPHEQWRNIALNIKCKEVSRTGIESPYSIFLNRKGFSYCAINKRQYRIETDTFLFAQPGDTYDLVIDNHEQTEICNLHINTAFFNDAAHALSTPSHKLLTQPQHRGEEFRSFTQLHEQDTATRQLTARIARLPPGDAASFEPLLIEVINHLLLTHTHIKNQISSLPFMKASVREDIYRRLAIARDYIYSHYHHPIDLDSISTEIGMSKFHFLRMFRALYGITPYQYLSNIRMNKAAHLLQTSDSSINEIAASLGFEYPNSLIKTFRKAYSMAPHQYRRQFHK